MIYSFGGVATVSVGCRVEADSEQEARAMVASGDCVWECEMVDGDVSELELLFEEE